MHLIIIQIHPVLHPVCNYSNTTTFVIEYDKHNQKTKHIAILFQLSIPMLNTS